MSKFKLKDKQIYSTPQTKLANESEMYTTTTRHSHAHHNHQDSEMSSEIEIWTLFVVFKNFRQTQNTDNVSSKG